jgi:hypothetical protein
MIAIIKRHFALVTSLFILLSLGMARSQGTFTFTVTFDGQPFIPLGASYIAQQYTEANFWFRNVIPGPGYGFIRCALGQDYPMPFDPTYYIQSNGGALVFSRTDNAQFGVASVQLAAYAATTFPDFVTDFVGYHADGTTVTNTFSGSGIAFRTFNFGPEFSNLSRVEIPGSPWSLDNLVVVVPEPGVLPLAVFAGALVAARAGCRPWKRGHPLTPFQGGGGAEQAIPDATGSQYTVQAVGCGQEGTYRVQVNCGDGSATATAGVQHDYNISFVELKLVPANVGTGNWSYQWSVSDNVGGPYTALLNETQPTLVLYVDRSAIVRHYMCAASRFGGSASLIAQFDPANLNYTSPSVTLEQKSDAELDVTYAAGVGAGPWDYRWYFAPPGATPQPVPGATASQYTIQPVGCPARGTYKCTAEDACGRTFTYDVGNFAGLDVFGCP